jgi:hypothetical protein
MRPHIDTAIDAVSDLLGPALADECAGSGAVDVLRLRLSGASRPGLAERLPARDAVPEAMPGPFPAVTFSTQVPPAEPRAYEPDPRD